MGISPNSKQNHATWNQRTENVLPGRGGIGDVAGAKKNWKSLSFDRPGPATSGVVQKREMGAWQQEREFYNCLNDPTPMTSPEHMMSPSKPIDERRLLDPAHVEPIYQQHPQRGASTAAARSRSVMPPSGASRPANHLEINKLAQVSKLVPGVSASQCRSALEAVNWDTSTAVKNLKIDRLYRLGVSEKATCQHVLENVGWDLERAAAMLLEQ